MGFRDLWAYGVTTVPARRCTLLPKTLASLTAAGFPDPAIFVDGEGEGYADLTSKLVRRVPVIGAYGNWLLAMVELYIRCPGYDRYAIFQDDVLFYPNLRKYLNSIPYPKQGYLNLYTVPRNEMIAPNAVGFFDSQIAGPSPDSIRSQIGKGALGLVFDFHAAETLLNGAFMFARAAEGLHNDGIDGAVVTAMNIAGWREYVHNPTLCQHIGDVSSIKETKALAPKPTSWRGEEYDATRLLRPHE